MISDSSDSDDENAAALHRRPRNFKIRNDFEEYDFKRKFRLTFVAAEDVLLVIGADLQSETLRNMALTPRQQLLVFLRFVASNSIYSTLADAHGISIATVSRCIHKVCDCIIRHFHNDVHFPINTNRLAQDFFEVAGMPSVAGCVDGTHINILAPHENENQYVDRHHNHSINALGVCGPDLRVYYINSRWPGATNDSRVLRNSKLAEDWNNGYRPFPDAMLLADSGFPCLPWNLTPILVVNRTPAEDAYNRAHKKTRRLIECCFGVLKKRFMVLATGIRASPEFAGQLIVACVCLHNICLDHGDIGEVYEVEEIELADPGPLEEEENFQRRNRIVQFFEQQLLLQR
jgi:hypothetical protein